MSLPVDGLRRVTGRELLLGGAGALLAMAVVLVAWMVGWHLLGAGLGVLLAGVLPAALSGLAVQWWVLVRRCGWRLADLGFTRARRSLWHLLWEAPLLMTCSAGLAATLGGALGLEKGQASNAAVTAGLSPMGLACTALATVLVVPLVEEVIFRRLLLGWLQARLGLGAAVLVTGLLFGACHVAPLVMLYVVPWGVGITVLRAWHGTLWGSLLPHVTNNALITALGLLAVS